VKYFAMTMLAVAVLAVAVPASAGVLLSEDFESYSAGTAIQDLAAWSNSSADGPIRVNGYNENSAGGHRLLGSGLALDGNSGKEQGSGVGRVWSTSKRTIPGPSANALTYTVAFDTIVQRGSNSNGTGNSGLYIECGSACGEFGFHFQRSNNYGWGFINSGDGLANVGQYTGSSSNATPPESGIWHAVNNPTTASITLDKTTMLASATVGGYDFDPQPFTQAVWDGISGLRVRNDINNPAHEDHNFGMDVDNIVVSETIPEPATIGLVLLGLCGLAVMRRK